ncbi:MAG: LD-carboxypeptidase [Crocinitomicaceae bacterium]|nr:LD-carboxypeptidase [Crocinitomicaceae bacterium]
MNAIPYLKKGDLIEIVAPAKAIEKELIEFAKIRLEEIGFKVKISPNCTDRFNYFSGTDEQRLTDFQQALDNPDVKAIICARGGYGAVRIVDKIKWANQLISPKWIVGFSDITVFHQQMQLLDQKSIHATMPLNYNENSKESIETLIDALTGKSYSIEIEGNDFNKKGSAIGKIIGGNLSILYSLIGTDSMPDYKNKILFIEDVGEQLYSIDRMLFSFKKSGILDEIKGLIVGGMTNIKDSTEVSIGMNIEDIILQHFQYRRIPICFNFPSGHLDDNRAIVLNETVNFEVTNKVNLTFNRE